MGLLQKVDNYIVARGQLQDLEKQLETEIRKEFELFLPSLN